MYPDSRLKKSDFPGALKADGSVIVVKTHYANSDHIAIFDKAILLVREPYGAIKVLHERVIIIFPKYVNNNYNTFCSCRTELLQLVDEWEGGSGEGGGLPKRTLDELSAACPAGVVKPRPRLAHCSCRPRRKVWTLVNRPHRHDSWKRRYSFTNF